MQETIEAKIRKLILTREHSINHRVATHRRGGRSLISAEYDAGQLDVLSTLKALLHISAAQGAFESGAAKSLAEGWNTTVLVPDPTKPTEELHPGDRVELHWVPREATFVSAYKDHLTFDLRDDTSPQSSFRRGVRADDIAWVNLLERAKPVVANPALVALEALASEVVDPAEPNEKVDAALLLLRKVLGGEK